MSNQHPKHESMFIEEATVLQYVGDCREFWSA